MCAMWKHCNLQYKRHVETSEWCQYPHYMWKPVLSMIRKLGLTQTIYELTMFISGVHIP